MSENAPQPILLPYPMQTAQSMEPATSPESTTCASNNVSEHCEVLPGPGGPIYRCVHPSCIGKSKEWVVKNDFTKHYKNHTRPISCTSPACRRGEPGKGFAQSKDMYRHCWVAHRTFAARKGYPNPEAVCEFCGSKLKQKSNLARHKIKSCSSRPR